MQSQASVSEVEGLTELVWYASGCTLTGNVLAVQEDECLTEWLMREGPQNPRGKTLKTADSVQQVLVLFFAKRRSKCPSSTRLHSWTISLTVSGLKMWGTARKS